MLSTQEFLQALHDDLVVVLLSKAAYHDGGDRALDALYTHREPAAVDGIVASRLAQLEPRLEVFLIAHIEQIMASPRAPSEPEHEVPLSLHPVVILRHGTGPRCGVEEELLVVGERDVDDRRLVGELSEPVADQYAEVEGILGGEVRQDERLFLFDDFGKLVCFLALCQITPGHGARLGLLTPATGVPRGFEVIVSGGESPSVWGRESVCL